MWEKPQHLRFSLIPSYQINTLRSKRFLEPKLHHIQLLCALLLAKPASASLLTSLALLTMIHFLICAPSSNRPPEDQTFPPQQLRLSALKKGLWQSNKLPVVIPGWSLFNQPREPFTVHSAPTLGMLRIPPTWVGGAVSLTLVVPTRIAMCSGVLP